MLERLADRAARLERQNEAAYAAAARRLAREFDVNKPSGWLPRAYRQKGSLPWGAPAERKRELLMTSAGRTFHGGGTAYSKPKLIKANAGPSRRTGSAAAHHRYIHSHGAQGAEHSAYISRSDRDWHPDRTRSNISMSFVERMRFFELVESMERDAGGDAITVDFDVASPRLLAALHAMHHQPELQRVLADHAARGSTKPRRIPLEGSAADFRACLQRHGAIILSKTGKRKRTKNKDCLQWDGIAFHEERAGRTHYRWVFELPREFTAKQRRRVLEKLAAYMNAQRFMYSAVIHEPDPHNDERNHHLHLMWYDRPCRRLTGREDDDLVNVSPNFKEAVADDMRKGLFTVGEWDFAMERHYKSGRNWKTHYPFRAAKPRDGLHKDRQYQKKLRADYAAIVNQVAQEEHGHKIYDARSNKDRGFPNHPISESLGPSLHMAEVCGLVTEVGRRNELAQSSAERQAIISRWRVEDQPLAEWQRSTEQAAAADDGPQTAKELASLLAKIRAARHAAELRKVVALLELEMARQRSRAERTASRQRRASAKGSTSQRHMRLALAQEAESYLAALSVSSADLLRGISAAKSEIDSVVQLTMAEFERKLADVSRAREREAAERTVNIAAQTAAAPVSTKPQPAVPVSTLPVSPQPAPRQVAGGISDEREREQAEIIRIVEDLLATPGSVRRVARAGAAKPRFELTDKAGGITAKLFREHAENPALHRLLGKFVSSPAPAAQQVASTMPAEKRAPAAEVPAVPEKLKVPSTPIPTVKAKTSVTNSDAATETTRKSDVPSRKNPIAAVPADSPAGIEERVTDAAQAGLSPFAAWLSALAMPASAGASSGQESLADILLQAQRRRDEAAQKLEAKPVAAAKSATMPADPRPAASKAEHQAAYERWRQGGGGIGGS